SSPNFALGVEPVLVGISVDVAALLKELVGANANLNFQVGGNVIRNRVPVAGIGHLQHFLLSFRLHDAGGLCFGHRFTPSLLVKWGFGPTIDANNRAAAYILSGGYDPIINRSGCEIVRVRIKNSVSQEQIFFTCSLRRFPYD